MMRTHRTVSTTMTMMVALLAASAGHAAESGSALYIGGSQAFGAGVTPPPGVYVTTGALIYDGDVGAVIEGGVVDLNAGKTALAVIGNLKASGWGIGDVSLKIQNGWSHGTTGNSVRRTPSKVTSHS